MSLHSVERTIVRTYEKITPDLRLPYLIIFAFPLILLSFLQYFKENLLSFLKKFNLSFAQVFKVTKKKSLRKSQPQRRKKLSERRFAFHIPVLIKLRYFSLGVIFSLLFAFLPLVILIFIQELPNPKELEYQQIPQTTKIYDRNNILLYEIYSSQNRTIVPLTDIPTHLQQATLAIEDKNFYKHPGFDITSIIRALRENARKGSALQGASTITQQLIKASLLNSERKFSRKIKEVVLAFWAEHIYSKHQILEMYFNRVPYGGTAWGVEAASEVYFGKHVKDVTLAESAFLAGLTQAPSIYSPFGPNPNAWKNRQKEVLSRMVATGYISQTQANAAMKEELVFRKQETPIKAPHFVMFVKDWLIKEHGLAAVEKGGLTVITSLDLKKQELSEKIVKEEIENDAYLNVTNGAVLVTNPKNGDILTMVGSKDYDDPDVGNVNITERLRQPGSTVKAITYSAALMKNFTAASILDDSPITFPGGEGAPSYSPVNYDGTYRGKVTLRFALANSLNLPAVKTLNSIGVPTMVNLARKMGITHWNEPDNAYGLSTTLGASEATMLDMATVFGTLSNAGERVDLNPILSVTDAKGNILEQKTAIKKTRVLPEGIAYIISNILSDNQTRTAAFGPNSVLAIPGQTVSVKTGTSDNKRDNWTIGYTDNYVVTAWVGNNDNSWMSQALASGITGAAPIWHRVMEQLLVKSPASPPSAPADVVMKYCLGRNEFFLKGTENSINCGNPPPNQKIITAN